MEDLRQFLETSTVHGLAYISNTKRSHVRLLWTLIVTSGFTVAGIMIYHSFKDWTENPVTTTVETRPITEITFPKVTICPPRNTFTDLNYYLKLTENMTLDNISRIELANYAVELIYNDLYEKIMANLSLMEDSARYYNWYHGFTKIKLPFKNLNLDQSPIVISYPPGAFVYIVSTTATSGTVFT